MRIFVRMAHLSKTGFWLFLFFLCACRTPKPVTDTVPCVFRVSVSEKYCTGARADEARRQAHEREKPYASQALFLVNRDSKTTFTFTTDEAGRATGNFPGGTYDLYLPEKRKTYSVPGAHCLEWQARPDTVLSIRNNETIVLSLKRGCNPCVPATP